ncbi:ankyrin repeat domain-containing protein [Candidatus Chromulinivorax destructor]|uniref:Uncharacterized protein n=1 Tax=Candidatus Chromulinivorax destructor TaxID=2066483 RepID=A0A345ZA88_9BACT|nr:ankyrin repeat domain-containing protein [Candidatus Chromulinivorax destructor]AXK60205.1 hypothetical protein C0J27_00370 [Candidatus Chromulinivorax destructor]
MKSIQLIFSLFVCLQVNFMHASEKYAQQQDNVNKVDYSSLQIDSMSKQSAMEFTLLQYLGASVFHGNKEALQDKKILHTFHCKQNKKDISTTQQQEMNLVEQCYPGFFSDDEGSDLSGRHYKDVYNTNEQIKNKFLEILDRSLHENKNLNCYKNDPIFSHVMQHKNGYMQERVNTWLSEWAFLKNDKLFPLLPSLPSLSCSILLDHVEIAHMLLAIPEINTNIPKEINFLHCSAYYGSKKVIKYLLTMPDCDVNTKNYSGQTALHYAAEEGLVDVIELLLTAPNIDVNIQDEDGQTCLHYAILEDKNDSVKYLLTAPGIQVNIQDEDGFTPLHTAVYTHRAEMVRSLLSSPDIQVNIQDQNGNTPLHNAIRLNYSDIVELLLAVPEINVDIANEDGCSAFDLPKTEAVRALFLQAGFNCSKITLIQLDPEKTLSLLRVITLHGINIAQLPVKAIHEDNVEQLHLPEIELLRAILILLGEEGILLEGTEPTQEISTHVNKLLYFAIHHGLTNAVQLLLKIPEININSQDEDGESSLHYAVKSDRADIVKLLLARPEIDVNIQDKNGDSPLDYAFEANRINILQLLFAVPQINLDIESQEDQVSLDDADDVVEYTILVIKQLLKKARNSNIDINILRHLMLK